MSHLNKEKINEFKSYLKGLIEERNSGKEVDFNKAIAEKYNVILSVREEGSYVGVYGEDIYTDSDKKSLESVLESWLNFNLLHENVELNSRLRKNNYCCSFSNSIINIEEDSYVLPTYKFINENYTDDCFIDFNGMMKEEELLNNFPMGRSFNSFSNETILNHISNRKNILKEGESLNYYVRNITTQIASKNESVFLKVEEIPEKIGHSIHDCGEYIEIKDYDNNLFKINKIDELRVDFDTTEKCS